MRLTVKSHEGCRLVLVQDGREFIVVRCTEPFTSVVGRWRNRGLVESLESMTGGEFSSEVRLTPPDHPEFLQRAASFFRRNFQFQVELSEA